MKYTNKTLSEKLAGKCSMVGKNKKGNFVARKSFFFTSEMNSQKFADKIAKELPAATIVDHGEVWKSFIGGASIQRQSHWWVEFNFDQAQECINTCPQQGE